MASLTTLKKQKQNADLLNKDPGTTPRGAVLPGGNNFTDKLKDTLANHQNNNGSNNGTTGGWGNGNGNRWNDGNGNPLENWWNNNNPGGKDDGYINVKPGSYDNAYSGAINKLIDQAVNRQPFQYDPATDAAYQAYARQYTRLGNQAAQDTLADVAAQTGGLASSYATTAASQARANYNQALTDKIPELMQLAYDKYRNQYQDTMSNIDMLTGLSNSLYGRYADKRDFDQAVKQYEQQLAQSQNAQKYEQMLNMWATLGYANSTVAAFFGIPVGTKTDDASYRAAQLALQSRP
jgi:hypothetical protein